MKITEFALKVSEQEGLKKGVNIAQISEILKVANSLLDGELYALVRKQPEVTVLNPKNNIKLGGRAIVNKAKDAKSKSTVSKKKS